MRASLRHPVQRLDHQRARVLVAQFRRLAAHDNHDRAFPVARAREDDRGSARVDVAGLEAVHLALAPLIEDLLLVLHEDVVVVDHLERLAGAIGDGAISAIIIILGAVLSHVCWNFPYVANVSMIAVAGKTPEDRSQLASTRAFWANMSNILFAYVGMPIATVVAGFIGETNKFGATAFILGAIMAVMYFAHFKMFEGYEEVEAVTESKKDTTRTSGGDLLRALAQNPPLIALLIADVAKWMFNFVCMGAAVYYFTYVAGNAGLLATYILISNILCVVGSYLSKYVSNKISTRNTTLLCFYIMAVFCVLAYVMRFNTMAVLIFMSVARFGYGIAYACTPALYADTIIYSEWKTGKNATGWISGLQNVPLKVSIMTRGIIINSCLAAGLAGAAIADIDPTAASVELQNAISMAFILIPAIALIIAGVLITFGFRLTKEKVLQYQSEIAARKAKA